MSRRPKRNPKQEMSPLLVIVPEVNNQFLRPAVEDGDWDWLAEYLDQCGGQDVTPEMCKFLAKVLRKEVSQRKGKGRPRTRRTHDLHMQIDTYVRNAMNNGKDESQAKKDAANKFGVTTKRIQNGIKWVREAEEIWSQLQRDEGEVK
jgi:hypothetical protein